MMLYRFCSCTDCAPLRWLCLKLLALSPGHDVRQRVAQLSPARLAYSTSCLVAERDLTQCLSAFDLNLLFRERCESGVCVQTHQARALHVGRMHSAVDLVCPAQQIRVYAVAAWRAISAEASQRMSPIESAALDAEFLVAEKTEIAQIMPASTKSCDPLQIYQWQTPR